MPEMRHDPLQRRWVVIATERGNRPSDYKLECPKDNGQVNPFLEGNEAMTPPEIAAARDKKSAPDTPGWQVRVVPNKYPALKIEGDLNREGLGLYDKMNGVGAHEVVIETPDPGEDLANLSPEHAFEVAKIYRERLIDLMRDMRFRYVLIFKNHGKAAGASQPHPHTQIIATPVTPRTIAMELESAKNHFNAKERCLFCDLIHQEIVENRRIIAQNEKFIAYAPYASRFPFEVCLAPKQHSHDFRDVTDEELKLFMEMLQDILQRLKIGLKDPPYNWMLHTAPNTFTATPRPSHWATIQHDWHWHLEIIPRLTSVAGFEWGTGLFINPTPPEQAAEFLRGVMLD